MAKNSTRWAGGGGNGGLKGYFLNVNLIKNLDTNIYDVSRTGNLSVEAFMGNHLFVIAIITFISAFILSFLFTYLRSKKTNTPLWGSTSKRLFINVMIPMIAGGVYLLKLIENEAYGLIAPGCLIFYGLALVNASKYTLGEVRYLGYCQIALGLINLW